MGFLYQQSWLLGMLQMIKRVLGTVGVGVCMQNGADVCKSVANYVTDLTNDQGAVGHFIEDYFKED